MITEIVKMHPPGIIYKENSHFQCFVNIVLKIGFTSVIRAFASVIFVRSVDPKKLQFAK